MTENEALDNWIEWKRYWMKLKGVSKKNRVYQKCEQWAREPKMDENQTKRQAYEGKKVWQRPRKKNALQHIHLCNFSYSLDSLS